MRRESSDPTGGPAPSELVGAYGFRLTGLPDLQPYLNQAQADWPELALATEAPPPDGKKTPGTIELEDDGARLWLAEAGCIRVTRSPLTVTFGPSQPLSPEAILHPFLGVPAAIAARWQGRLAFHSAAFVQAGRCWALLGDRGAGKSTTLALLMRAGCEAVTDDVLILDGGRAFSGPRCVDLRSEAAGLGGEHLGVVGNRERWRLRPSPAPGVTPLGGWIDLAWGDRLEVRPLGAEERLELLARSSVFELVPENAAAVLDLSALPAWSLTRPHELQNADSAVGRLLEEIGRA